MVAERKTKAINLMMKCTDRHVSNSIKEEFLITCLRYLCACLLLRWRRKAARRREENRRTHPPTAATMYNLIVTCKNVFAMYRVSQKKLQTEF